MSKAIETTLPAGTYYIGDLCYVIGKEDKDWMDFLNNSFWRVAPERGPNCGGPVDYKGHKGFAAYTAHGDGCYQDQWYNEYPVDAGMIGIIPVEACEVELEQITKRKLGHVATFTSEVLCRRDEYGTFCFSSTEYQEVFDISTSWEEESVDEEDE